MVSSSMLKSSRAVELPTTSVMGRTRATGKPPLAWRSCSVMAAMYWMRIAVGADQPDHGADAGVEGGHAVGDLGLGTIMSGRGSLLSPPSRMSPTTPMIWRAGSVELRADAFADEQSAGRRGSALGQYFLAMVSLMMTTPGAEPVSCSVKSRPRRMGILKTAK